MEQLTWDEKNLIEQKKNSLKCKDQEPFDITIEIKPESTREIWKDIGSRKTPQTKTTDEFVQDAIELRGDRYDYSKVIYKKSSIKVEIVCKLHGSFFQEPSKHLGGQNCPTCGWKIPTNDKFIERSRKVHGDKYDYSSSLYKSATEKVDIICPIHGTFSQIPKKHILGKQGCPCCSNNIKYTKDVFVEKANKIHGCKYDYSNVEYKNNRTPVEIICRKHGKFYQAPHKHLKNSGCVKCSHCISKMETEFLDFIGVKDRNYKIDGWVFKKSDGFDCDSNTVYEFLGDYWHGNPIKYNHQKINTVVGKTFGELHEETFLKFDKLVSLGYNVKYIWESDWKTYLTSDKSLTHLHNNLIHTHGKK